VSFIGNMWEKMWSDGILCGFDGDSDSIWL
jgi:hypothetical protein